MPPKPAASPLSCGEPPADRSGKLLGVPSPHVLTRWPFPAPQLPPRCREERASLGDPRPGGMLLFGALGRNGGRWSTGRQGPGFPSWHELKVSTHKLWDLRRTTTILWLAVTAPDSRLTWSNWSDIRVRPLEKRLETLNRGGTMLPVAASVLSRDTALPVPPGPRSLVSRGARLGAGGPPDDDMSTYPGARRARVTCVSLEALEEKG